MVISFRVRIIIRPFLEMAQPHMISHNIAVHHSQGVWTNSHAIVIAVISTVFIVFLLFYIWESAAFPTLHIRKYNTPHIPCQKQRFLLCLKNNRK